MENISVEITGDTLVLRIDLSKRGGPSGTGKTTRVASTHGNIVPDPAGHPTIRLGVNCYEQKQKD